MPQYSTQLERFRDQVSRHDDIKNVVKLFTDIALIEGDWIMSNKEIIIREDEAWKDWQTVRASLTADVAQHGYDVSQWSTNSVTAVVLPLLALPELIRLMKKIFLGLAEAQDRDAQPRAVGRLIGEIIRSGKEEEDEKETPKH